MTNFSILDNITANRKKKQENLIEKGKIKNELFRKV